MTPQRRALIWTVILVVALLVLIFTPRSCVSDLESGQPGSGRAGSLAR
jgi:hypothetical protein